MKVVKPLKHYRRKRFLHRFLLMDSPRSAQLIGLGLLFLAALWRSFGFLLLVNTALRTRLFDPATVIAAGTLLLLPGLLLFVGVVFLGSGKYDGIRHWRLRDLLTFAHWKKCWSLLFAAAAALFFAVGGETPITLAAALFALVLAVVFAPDRRPIKAAAWLPLILAFLTLAGMFCGPYLLDRDIRAQGLRLARLIDGGGAVRDPAPSSVAEYDARESGSLSERAEPLKTMIATEPEKSPYVWYHSPAEARKALAEFRAKDPQYLAATERFLALPVGFLREEYDPASGLYENQYGRLVEAACSRALLLRCAGNKAEAVRTDAEMRKLRDWCLNSHSLIARLAAVRIETIRLQAIAGTLPQMPWSREEYMALLGDSPDWDQAFRRSVGDEAYQWLRIIGAQNAEFAADSPWGIYLLFDRRNLLRRSIGTVEIARRQDLDYAAKRAMLRELDRPAGFLYSDLLGGLGETKLRSFVRIRDRRTMAEAAFEVFAELRRNAAPPERPRALDGLRDRWNDRPFGFGSGEIAVDADVLRRGFRIFVDAPENKQGSPDEIVVLW